MGWDLFISYASEDRDEVAVPLAEALREAGVRVWLDQNELRLGDSLREKIDGGLANSDFGVVILSESYLAKRWPRRELNGLLAREIDGHPVLLPVWHKLDSKSLLTQSPILADRIAANTRDGIPAVAAMIAEVVFDPARAASGGHATTLAGRLSGLLRTSTAAEAADPVITAFLRHNSAIIAWAAGSPRLTVRADLDLGPHHVDFAMGAKLTTANRWTWRMIILGPVVGQLAVANDDGNRAPSPQLGTLLDEADSIHAWVDGNLAMARRVLPDLLVGGEISIVFGRRTGAAEHVTWLADLNDSLFSVRVRTYDWLVEAAANITNGSTAEEP